MTRTADCAACGERDDDPALIVFATRPTGDGFGDRRSVTICHACEATRPQHEINMAWLRQNVAPGTRYVMAVPEPAPLH